MPKISENPLISAIKFDEQSSNPSSPAAGDWKLFFKSTGAWMLEDDGVARILSSCGSGTSFPATPDTGQWYYRTDVSCLYLYNGTAWKPYISFGDMTLYVDAAAGSDAIGKGFASGTGATATITYAMSLIPPICGGHVTVNIAAGTYAENVVVPTIHFTGEYEFSLVGALTEEASGTITTGKRNWRTAGSGVASTITGGSTTVTLPSTTGIYPGCILEANSLARTVVSVDSPTTVTVNATVDWYNGGSGYSWTYTQFQYIDTGASWSDNEHNGRLIITDPGSANPHLRCSWIKDTNASDYRLELGHYQVSSTTDGVTTYSIYTLGTVIAPTVAGTDAIRMSGLKTARIKFIKFAGTGDDSISTEVGPSVETLWVYGCHFTGRNYALLASTGTRLILAECYCQNLAVNVCYASRYGLAEAQYCWIETSGASSKAGLATIFSHISLQYCMIDSSGTPAPIQATYQSYVYTYRNVIRRVSGGTTAITLDLLSGFRTLTDNIFLGWTTTSTASSGSQAV